MASSPQSSPPIASVRHAIENGAVTVFIGAKSGYEVSIMVGSKVQAIIYADDGSETVTIDLEPPEQGKSVQVRRLAVGCACVVYQK